MRASRLLEAKLHLPFGYTLPRGREIMKSSCALMMPGAIFRDSR